MRGAPSSWPDRGVRGAGLGFVVVALRAGHGSPATRMATTPTRASEVVVHLVLARRALDSLDLKAFTGAWEETMGDRCLHGSGGYMELLVMALPKDDGLDAAKVISAGLPDVGEAVRADGEWFPPLDEWFPSAIRLLRFWAVDAATPNPV